MRQRVVLFSLALLALAACQHERVSFVPDAMQDVAPIPAQVDPELWALTERWATWLTSGEASVGEVLPQILMDDPQALLRLTYVTYRPNLHRARYQLTVRVESPAIGVGQAFIEGRGEGQSTVSAGRASQEAITQAVRALARTLDALTRRG